MRRAGSVRLVFQPATRRSSCANGRGWSTTASSTPNIAVLAPMPMASVAMANHETPEERSLSCRRRA